MKITIELPVALHDFVQKQIAAGGYKDPGDYVTALIERSRKAQQSARLADLLEERLDAVERGDATVSTPAFFEELRKHLRTRHAGLAQS